MTTGNNMLLDLLISEGLDGGTDKNTVHSYIDVYESLFSEKRLEVKTFLEVGIYTGNSLYLWAKYFPNAKIWGVDNHLDAFYSTDRERSMKKEHRDYLLNNKHSVAQANAYSDQFVDSLPNFDIIIDDGSHHPADQLWFVKNYRKKVNPGGVMVVEDIGNMEIATTLASSFPQEESDNCQIYDLREIKNRSDDIMFVYRKPE